jgi:DNA-directed RNA polymerase subunit N (RpoN/RPB10)
MQPPSDLVCLRCGTCKHGIRECENEYLKRVASEEEAKRVQAERDRIAQDIYKMCEGNK